MERRFPAWIMVFGMASLMFFLGLGTPRLFDEDEPKNAECGREMFVRGDWLVPTFNEELRTDKPILVYWLMLTSYHVFGVSEFAARFWSAALGVGTCLLTFGIGRVLFSPRVGLWAGLVLSSTLMFTTIARASTPDSTLIFFTTLSLYLFVQLGSLGPEIDSNRPAGDWRSILPTSALSFLAIYAAMAMAVLAKGPVGVLLPSVVIGFFLYATAVSELSKGSRVEPATRLGRWADHLKRWFQPAPLFRIAIAMRPHWIVLALAAIALPWYIAVSLETEGAWLQGFWGQHNVGRFLKPMEGHRGPVVYYPIAILIGFFPWSVFCLPVLKGVMHRLRGGSAESRGLLFLVSWFSVYLVFFTCARTKLPNYVLPCYPAVALLTAWWFERAGREGLFENIRRDFAWAAWSLSAVGVVLAAGLGIAGSMLLEGETVLAAVGLVPIFAGLFVQWTLKRRRLEFARIAFAAGASLFILTVFLWAAPRISRHQDGAYLAEQIQNRPEPAGPVATYNYFAPGLVFYAERPIDRCRGPAEISEALAASGGLLITRADRLEELAPALPPGTEIIARRRRFLRRHDIIVLSRPRPARVALEPASRQ